METTQDIKDLRKKVHVSGLWKTVYSKDETLYQAMLQARYGTKRRKITSCTQLSEAELENLVSFLNGIEPAADAATPKQIRYVLFLWNQKSRAKTTDALLKFAARQTGRTYAAVNAISRADMKKIIPALERLG